MTEPDITATSDTVLAEAARVMSERQIGCLPVVEHGTLVGILTEGDFARIAADSPTDSRDDTAT